MVFAALTDDQVLRPTADEELAVGEVTEIPGVQPAVAQRLGGRLGILEVSLHHRRSPRDDCADPTLGQRASLLIDDPDLVIRKRAAAADEPHNLHGSIDRRCDRVPDKPIGVDGVDRDATGRERDGERVLCQSVTRDEARCAETGRREMVGEGGQRVRPNRLGATPSRAPGREIERIHL